MNELDNPSDYITLVICARPCARDNFVILFVKWNLEIYDRIDMIKRGRLKT